MVELDAITGQILRNCLISDSHHAGFYSICGLALRLRDLFKWEKGLDPWIEKDSSEVLKWIEEKEEKWEKLAEKDLDTITINGSKYDPFDTGGINTVLEPHGLFYGAGYAHSLKPTFFLAVLEAKNEIEGHGVYILGRELARDLFTAPALSQDDCILVRKESAKLFLWDKMFYINKSGRQALGFALEEYGLKEQNPTALHANLTRISAAETETYIYHELGEIKETVFDRDIWREIIAAYPRTPVELLVRTVKDLLADTNEYGTLRYIMREGRAGSLGFYVAFLEGLTKKLFPEIVEAFREFTQTHRWSVIEQAVAAGYHTGKQHAETITRIYQKGKRKNDEKWAKDVIVKQLLAPLGI